MEQSTKYATESHRTNFGFTGSSLPLFALLLASLTIFTQACGSGSSSPTEPTTDPAIFEVATTDDSSSSSNGSAEVDGPVTGVDPGSQSIFLGTGDQVIADSNTNWDPRGDLHSFSQLVGAFNAGQNVRVEADGSFTPSGAVLADTIKAETDGDDDPIGDDSDDSDFDDDIDSDDSDDSDFDDDLDSDNSDDLDSDDSDDSDDSEDSDDSDDSDNSGSGS